jgi:phosphoserine phosphatase RsbU/P
VDAPSQGVRDDSGAAASDVGGAGGWSARIAPAWKGTSFKDFLTDGSVAALCDEIAKLSGCPIWLRDATGQVIAPSTVPKDQKGEPWLFLDERAGRARSLALIVGRDGVDPAAGGADGGGAALIEEPLAISTGTLGWIVAEIAPSIKTSGRHALREAIRLLALSVCDVCEAQVALRKRVRELDALYQLSSILTEVKEPEDTLRLALDLAVRVLNVDAGSVAVIEDSPDIGQAMADGPSTGVPGGGVLRVKASIGLSPAWLANQAPLSVGGSFRSAVLAGDVVSIADLQSDPRISDRQRVLDEGLHSLLSVGLLDQGRPIGLIRLYTRAPRVFTSSEGELLRAIGEHSASALAGARLRRLRLQDEFIQRQVRLAAAVQRRMLPKAPPNVPPFDVAAHYAPSLDLGGDFYDFIVLGGHLAVMIGDVVGKGVPAALLMSSVRASLRAHAQDVYDIEQVLSRTNRALVRDTLDNEFATCWYGVADPATLRLTYCGAGHDWPILVRLPRNPDGSLSRPVSEQDLIRLTADGMALGIDAQQIYPKGIVHLQPGDCLVATTDGVHDATNFDGKRFGGTRLRKAILEILAEEPKASAARVVEHVIRNIRQFTGLAGRADDLTLLVLRVSDK